MPENGETGREKENFRFTVSRLIKNVRKKSETLQKSLLSATIVQKQLKKSTRLLADLKKHDNRIFIFSMMKLLPLILSSTNRMFGS